jgi:WD40 repeat protein
MLTKTILIAGAIAGSLIAFPFHAQSESHSIPTWKPLSTEYTRVQVADWLDDTRFAVGRWDGSISIFRIPKEGEFTPVLLSTRATTNGDGVEMIIALGDGFILSTDTSTNLKIWSDTAQVPDINVKVDSKFGMANSGAVILGANGTKVITGHTNGYLVVWRYKPGSLIFERAIDARSSDPIPSPYPLKNIRGVAHWRDSKVIAGSEDGDITLIDVETGKVLARNRYNQSAQRGVNNISVSGDTLLLANCSVGSGDDNLWIYRISETGFKRLDSINLIFDSSRPQSFNFDADLVFVNGELEFYASTEEGLLWAGKVDQDRLLITKSAPVAGDGGAFLDVNPTGKYLLAGARKLFLFDILQSP